MASVKKRGDKYYAKFRGSDGKTVYRVTTAKTKALALKIAFEWEGQEPKDKSVVNTKTVKELFHWWLENFSAKSPSHYKNVHTIEKNFIDKFADLKISELKRTDVEQFLVAKSQTLAPQTVNHLRRFLGTAFAKAIENGVFVGINPVVAVKRRKVPQRVPTFLRAEEVSPFLYGTPEKWRPLFAVAVYTGLRKGELFALRKSDVDFNRKMVTVSRSHERETTKGGHGGVITIPDEAAEYLKQAMDRSPNELVFPSPTGKMYPRGQKLDSIVRSALRTGGIIESFVHTCRFAGCKHTEESTDDVLRRCPVHNYKLWPRLNLKKLRFHDLRHTAASNMLMSGTPMFVVQRHLRHKDIQTTVNTYGHLDRAYIEQNVAGFGYGVKPPSAFETSKPVGPNWGQEEKNTSSTRSSNSKKTKQNQDLKQCVRRESNPRPSASKAGTDALTNLSKQYETSNYVSLEEALPTSPVQPFTDFVKSLGPNWGQEKLARTELSGPVETMLTVRDVATLLNVSISTVYLLCERGELPHVRISNTYRFSANDVQTFIRSPKK